MASEANFDFWIAVRDPERNYEGLSAAEALKIAADCRQYGYDYSVFERLRAGNRHTPYKSIPSLGARLADIRNAQDRGRTNAQIHGGF